MTKGPPGWAPHLITSRLDGWVCDPEYPERIPHSVADVIFRSMPGLGDGNTVADIRARMVARMARMGLVP